MATQEVDVLSRIGEQGEPLLGNCTLLTGDGAVIFEHGRARVPVDVARKLLYRGDIEVPVLANEPTPVGATSDQESVEPTAEERIADLERQLAQAKALAESAAQTKPGAETPPELDEAARAEQVRLAQEFLASEGEHVPDPEPQEQPEPDEPGGVPDGDEDEDEDNEPKRGPIPAGFENQTAEGELRCLAAKNDGSQCKNAAVDDGNACGLAPHQEKFA